jgi:phosphoribosylamine--glycine ligase
MVVVGPEDPLVAGIVDFFAADPQLKEIPVIGPSRAGAQLEGSKDFAKAFMGRHGIPTARHLTVTRNTVPQGIDFLKSLEPPYVLKADGLAAGKGVVIQPLLNEAITELEDMLSGKFGKASERVVVEEFLDGIELSAFAVTDGQSYQMLPAAKDYKRIGDNDTGPNTGGMGAVSPVPFADEAFLKKVEERIIRPTVDGLKKENIPYKGFLFAGLMKVGDDPFVIEYNCRLGDPETEAVVPRIQTDFVSLFQAVAAGTLRDFPIRTDDRTAATVVLASDGYPGGYEKGKPIEGLENTGRCLVFQAGTRLVDGQRLTAGGRVIAVTALAGSLDGALAVAYGGAEQIRFENKYYRKDIGADLLRQAGV